VNPVHQKGVPVKLIPILLVAVIFVGALLVLTHPRVMKNWELDKKNMAEKSRELYSRP
jgi:hypothetical protein